MNKNTLFTIAIPAFKSKFLGEAIESCLLQTYSNFEVVIVDDASPEDLKSVVDGYHDDRIRFYRNEKNCGAVDVVDNWNICLSYAKGDYIICMGDDDRLLPCCLEEYLKLMEKYPGLGVYHAWTEIIDEDSNVFDLQQPRPEWESVLSLIWNRWNGREKQFIGDFCFSRNCLLSLDGFYKLPMAWGSDDISAVRSATQGGIANTQTLCFQYRVNRHTRSKTGSQVVKVEAIIKERIWYSDYLSSFDKLHNLTPTDEIFLKLTKKTLYHFFYIRFKLALSRDMKNKWWRISYWMKRHKELHCSKFDILYFLLIAIKEKIKQ